MNIVTQEAKNKEIILKYCVKHSISKACRKYGVSRASVYRWRNKYDGTWKSLLNKSHRPHTNPRQHTKKEERQIKNSFKLYERYGYEGVYSDLRRKGYNRSYSGMVYAIKRLGLVAKREKRKGKRVFRRYPEILIPGEKVQIDVKEVPYNCLRGDALRNNRRLYQWTAIDECTRLRYVYGYEEHTPENTIKFINKLREEFPFEIKTIQTDNGLEFTYKYISEEVISPVDKMLNKLKIRHVLIPPRTPWHNGKVERSHRNDQRYFYDWETFRTCEELNEKLEEHLKWSNNKKMRTLGWKSPVELLAEKMAK